MYSACATERRKPHAQTWQKHKASFKRQRQNAHVVFLRKHSGLGAWSKKGQAGVVLSKRTPSHALPQCISDLRGRSTTKKWPWSAVQTSKARRGQPQLLAMRCIRVHVTNMLHGSLTRPSHYWVFPSQFLHRLPWSRLEPESCHLQEKPGHGLGPARAWEGLGAAWVALGVALLLGLVATVGLALATPALCWLGGAFALLVVGIEALASLPLLRFVIERRST